jgi:hypothetical protein
MTFCVSVLALLLIEASLSPPAQAGSALAGTTELSVIDPPSEAPAAASFYVRVKIENKGSEPLRACETADGAAPPEAPCFAVAYRRDKRPPSLTFSRVETAPVLARSLFVPPGEAMERLVRITTASRGSEQKFFLYLIAGGAGHLDWKEVPLQVKLGPPAATVTRTVWTARSLLALYLVLVVLGVWWAVRRPGLGNA